MRSMAVTDALDAQRRLRTFEGFPWVHIQALTPPPVTEGHVTVLGLNICYSPYLSLFFMITLGFDKQ